VEGQTAGIAGHVRVAISVPSRNTPPMMNEPMMEENSLGRPSGRILGCPARVAAVSKAVDHESDMNIAARQSCR